MNQDTANEFRTYDLGLASALVTSGYTLVDLDKSNPSKASFIFHRDDRIDDFIRDYWDDQLEGSLQAYFNNLKRIKNQLYSS